MELPAVEKLISTIRARPTIYGPRPTKGKKKHQKILDGLWDEVAAEMNLPVEQLKLKWTTLRNCYARLLREERSNKAKKRHWYLRNQMSFMKDFILPYTEIKKNSIRRNFSLRRQIPPTDISTTKDKPSPKPKIESAFTCPANDISQEFLKSQFTIVETTAEEVAENSWARENNSSTTAENINYNNNCEVVKINPLPVIERVETSEETCQTSNVEKRSEANSLFLQSLLPDVNKLSERKQRIFKRKTLEVLEMLFDEGEFDVARDENYMRQCQMTRTNYNIQQQHSALMADKFVQKIEPLSP